MSGVVDEQVTGDEIRILTVRQPWAWAIIHGQKDVENRVRNIAGDYRGPVAIHAGLAPFEQNNMASKLHANMHGGETDTRIVFGAIIGTVDLVDVHTASVIGGCGWLRHDCPEHGTCREHCSTWAMGPAPEGWFQHLVFANPRPIAPIPFKGALGLRRIPASLVAGGSLS
ncbi:hypothetical protein KPL76_06250 [Subtercola sp. PAMC28395]|uniref:hypothetical protein n=1 Tax=Subtercola sp. PAMC28395 TaxID=2846775 RepID=UPI001C0E349E|nr:hypothetical protein [Subtercola sp. PAMC28395]QWT24955.1 hypothetical protein KPL76_06250 [Subtercola sp. PAMC28395]